MYNIDMWKKIKSLFSNTLFNIALIFGLAGLVLFFTLKDDGPQVMHALRSVSIPGLLLLFALMVFERFILGASLAEECKLTHPQYTYKQGFINAYVAGLFNNITPGASGGQIAQGYIFRKQGIPVSNSLGVLWLDFIVYQTTMCLFVLFLLILKFPYFYTHYSQYFLIVIAGFLVGAMIIVFLWILACSPKFYNWLTTRGISIAHTLHIVKDTDAAVTKLNTQLELFSKEVVVLKTHKKLILFLSSCDLARLLIYYSIPFLCASILGISVNGTMYINTVALASFVAMVNAFLPMPGSSGGTEATFILMFSTIFTKTQATTIMILWRVITFYQVLIVGSFVFLYARTRKDVKLTSGVPVTYTKEALEAYQKEGENTCE